MTAARCEMVPLGLVVGAPLVKARLGTPRYCAMHLAGMAGEVRQQAQAMDS